MDLQTLKHILDAEDIDPIAYSLDGGMPFEAYVLERRAGHWVVFYSEHGLRTGETEFEAEGDACSYLLELLLRDSTTRRKR